MTSYLERELRDEMRARALDEEQKRADQSDAARLARAQVWMDVAAARLTQRAPVGPVEANHTPFDWLPANLRGRSNDANAMIQGSKPTRIPDAAPNPNLNRSRRKRKLSRFRSPGVEHVEFNFDSRDIHAELAALESELPSGEQSPRTTPVGAPLAAVNGPRGNGSQADLSGAGAGIN